MKAFKRLRLIALFPFMWALGVVMICLFSFYMSWQECKDEFEYRWRGGYGG